MKERLKTEIQAVAAVSYLHLVIDLWSSAQKISVIGFKAHYVKNFRLHNKTIGFRVFKGSHTGYNMKGQVQEFLEEFDITLPQVKHLMLLLHVSIRIDFCNNIVASHIDCRQCIKYIVSV